MNIFDGPRGESLFDRPLIGFFRHNPLPELFRKVERLDDDRFLAVLSALAVERQLDRCLDAFLPAYERLTEVEGVFGFSMKVRLLKAFNFVPHLVLSATDLIREVRNKFAHDLDVASFDDLPEKLQNRLRNVRASIYARFGRAETLPKDSLKSEFRALAFFSIASPAIYP